MKVCPVCKSRCFDDMNVCYGCMHQFEEKQKSSEVLKEVLINNKNQDLLYPEYFEIEEYPIIEDIDSYYSRKFTEHIVDDIHIEPIVLDEEEIYVEDERDRVPGAHERILVEKGKSKKILLQFEVPIGTFDEIIKEKIAS